MSELKHLSWDDYLFQNRHKAYGAYALRTEEGRNLLKSLLIGVSFILALVLVFSFTTKDFEAPTKFTEYNPEIFDYPTDPPRKKPELPPAAKKIIPPATTKEKVDSDIIPDPKEDVVNETPFNKQDNIGKVEGDEDGNPNENSIQTQTQGVGNGEGDSGDGGDDGLEIKVEDDRIYQPRDVSILAIYPGCEKVGKDRNDLMKCMSEKMQADLGVQLQDFESTANRKNIASAKAKLQFVVDKSGKITNIMVQNSTNEAFSQEAKNALERISKRLTQKGKYIKPAVLDDGSVVNMSYVIPIQFELN